MVEQIAGQLANRTEQPLPILGECTQLLQDKIKQKKAWAQVSVSYKPLDLYKLIESVVLKQTEDQYLVAALLDQYGAGIMPSKAT